MEETESKSSQSGDIYVPWSQHLSGQITQWYRLHFRRSYLQRYTLGDKLQQHGEAPFSQQQIASCVLENFCENLCRCNWILLPQQVAQFQSDLIFVTCCSDKIPLQRQRFSQKFSSTHEAICRSNVLPHRVAATSRPTCSHGVICHRNVLLQLVA